MDSHITHTIRLDLITAGLLSRLLSILEARKITAEDEALARDIARAARDLKASVKTLDAKTPSAPEPGAKG